MPRTVDGLGALTPLDLARAGLASIRARLWLVLLVPVLAVGGVAVREFASEPQYEARATLGFDPLNDSTTFASLGVAPSPAPSTVDILGDAVLNEYRVAAAGSEQIRDPRSRLRLENLTERDAVLVAEGSTSGGARQLANAWCEALIRVRNAQIGNQLTAAQRSLSRQLDRLPPEQQTAIRGRSLIDRLDRILAARRATPADTKISRRAVAAALGPSSSDYLLALAAGLAAGFLLALLVGSLDGRLRTPETLASAFGLPLIGRLREESRSLTRGANHSDGDAAAARLRARLALATGGKLPATILVTAPDEASDTLFAASALGAAVSASDRRVAVLGWRPGSGRRGGRTLKEGMTLVEDHSEWPDLLTAVGRLSIDHDLVVVAAPALLESEESLLASQALSGWLLCASVGETTMAEAAAVRMAAAGVRTAPDGLLALQGARSRWTSLLVEESTPS